MKKLLFVTLLCAISTSRLKADQEYYNDLDLDVNVEAELKSALCSDRKFTLTKKGSKDASKQHKTGDCSIKKVWFVIRFPDGSLRRTVVYAEDGVTSYGGGDWSFKVTKNDAKKHVLEYVNAKRYKALEAIFTDDSPYKKITPVYTQSAIPTIDHYERSGSKLFNEYMAPGATKYVNKPE